MSIRHCPRCRAEVEDAGGYCLLGHPLRLEAPIDSLENLRAEVDRAFEQVRIDVAEVLNQVPVTAARTTSPPPPPARRNDPFTALESDAIEVGPDPMAEFAPAPRMDWGPERHGLLKRLG